MSKIVYRLSKIERLGPIFHLSKIFQGSYFKFRFVNLVLLAKFICTNVRKNYFFTGNRDHSNKKRVVTHTCRYSSRHYFPIIHPGVDDHPCFLTFITMISISCKITNFSLRLFVSF